MKLLAHSSPSNLLQPIVVSSEISQTPKKSQPKLSMIWIKEFDGKRQRLMARWVTQD